MTHGTVEKVDLGRLFFGNEKEFFAARAMRRASIPIVCAEWVNTADADILAVLPDFAVDEIRLIVARDILCLLYAVNAASPNHALGGKITFFFLILISFA